MIVAISVVWVLVMIGCIVGVVSLVMSDRRANRTFNFRQELIDFIYDIPHEIDYKLLQQDYASVSFEEMYNSVWKPINIEFYKNTQYLYPAYIEYKNILKEKNNV